MKKDSFILWMLNPVLVIIINPLDYSISSWGYHLWKKAMTLLELSVWFWSPWSCLHFPCHVNKCLGFLIVVCLSICHIKAKVLSNVGLAMVCTLLSHLSVPLPHSLHLAQWSWGGEVFRDKIPCYECMVHELSLPLTSTNLILQYMTLWSRIKDVILIRLFLLWLRGTWFKTILRLRVKH